MERAAHGEDRQVADQQQVDHRHGEALAERVHALARHGADEARPAAARLGGEARGGPGRELHVGVDEQEVLAPRPGGEVGAGVVLAGPALGERRHGFEAQARIAGGQSPHERRGAVGRVVVADQDLDGRAGAGQRGHERRADPLGLVAGRDQDRDEAGAAGLGLRNPQQGEVQGREERGLERHDQAGERQPVRRASAVMVWAPGAVLGRAPVRGVEAAAGDERPEPPPEVVDPADPLAPGDEFAEALRLAGDHVGAQPVEGGGELALQPGEALGAGEGDEVAA